MDDGFLALADWRRRVAEIYAAWRRESTTDPRAAWLRWRQARDELFRDHPQSPLPADTRARFGGLSYFDYDPAYRFTAVVESTEEAPSRTIRAWSLTLSRRCSARRRAPS